VGRAFRARLLCVTCRRKLLNQAKPFVASMQAKLVPIGLFSAIHGIHCAPLAF
jgi:hypothetical protein